MRTNFTSTRHEHKLQGSKPKQKQKMPRQPTFSVIKHEVPFRRVLNSLYIHNKWGNMQHHDRLLSSRYGSSWLLLLTQRESKLPPWKCRDGFSHAYTIPQLSVIFTKTIHQINNTGLAVKFILYNVRVNIKISELLFRSPGMKTNKDRGYSSHRLFSIAHK